MQGSQNPHGEHLNPKRAADIRRLSRTEVKTITEVFIGHGNLAYYRHKIGLAESPLCRLCGEDNETSTHILCDCPAISNKRQILTGYAYIDVAMKIYFYSKLYTWRKKSIARD